MPNVFNSICSTGIHVWLNYTTVRQTSTKSQASNLRAQLFNGVICNLHVSCEIANCMAFPINIQTVNERQHEWKSNITKINMHTCVCGWFGVYQNISIPICYNIWHKIERLRLTIPKWAVVYPSLQFFDIQHSKKNETVWI